MPTTESLLARLAEVEPAARALEESPADRRALTDKVCAVGHRILDELSERAIWDQGEGAPQELYDLGIPDQPQDVDGILDLFTREIDGPGLQPAHGGHLGYIPGGGIYAGALGDYLAAVTNRYSGVFYAGRGSVRVENLLVRWLCQMVGYPASAFGTLTSGGSIATLVGVTAARDAKGIRAREVERSVIYGTAQAHHCIGKAIAIAGLAECPRRTVPMDACYRMDAAALQAQIDEDKAAGLRPFLLFGTAGTTETGAMDPLSELADIAEAEDLWFHVDGAYGGAFLLLDDLKPRFAGIERADWG